MDRAVSVIDEGIGGAVPTPRLRDPEVATASQVDTDLLLRQIQAQAALLECVSDAVVGVSDAGRVTAWNAGAEAIYGWSAAEALGRPVDDVLPTDFDTEADDFAPVPLTEPNAVRAQLEATGRWHGRVRQRRADGRVVLIDSSLAAQVEADGRPAGVVTVNRDVTEAVATAMALRAQEALAQSVLDALPSRTAVVDARGIVIAVNRAWREFSDETGADPARTCVGADYVGELRRALPAAPSARQALMGLEGVLSGALRSFEMDYDMTLPGVERTYGAYVGPLPDGGAVVSHDDITWRKSLERQLSFRATHDTLTGLPNRFLLTDRLIQAMNRAARSRRKVGVLFADLDQFKVLNDTLGHAAGDQVLVAVARRLERSCRSTDSVTRFGGDEFVVVVEDVPDVETVEMIAGRMLDALTAPIRVDDTEMWFGVSIGAVVTDGTTRATASHVDDLLRDADTAMYQAKEAGRNRFVVFDPGMRERVATRMALTMSLRHAVEREELRLEYQPIFELRGDQPIGAEALVRWEHPTRGRVPPADFIEAAEESGLIVDIGAWVLDHACAQAAVWREQHGDGFEVAVNISPRQLQHPAIVRQVAEALARTQLPAGLLTLEITESALVADPEQAADTLTELKALGVRIAVDDFGTGYSSLAYLQRFPVDTLKVDRSFVSRVADTPKTAALVSGIIGLAQSLGLSTVAEGVETTAQLSAVRASGCDAFQGFLMARPMAAESVSALLSETAFARR